MINKKLDDILQDISILKDIFNNNEYFKKIEEVIERQNKWNNELVEKINNLQSKIDKANELIKRKLSTETYQHLKNLYDDIDSTEEIWEDYEFEDLQDILKEDK